MDALNALEKLMDEYSDELTFEFTDLPKGFPGYIQGNHITVNGNLPLKEILAILAEEIGHYETSVGDISNYRNHNNMKQEIRARRWSYKKLIPHSNILRYVNSHDPITARDVAMDLNLPENIVSEAIEMYKTEGKI